MAKYHVVIAKNTDRTTTEFDTQKELREIIKAEYTESRVRGAHQHSMTLFAGDDGTEYPDELALLQLPEHDDWLGCDDKQDGINDMFVGDYDGSIAAFIAEVK